MKSIDPGRHLLVVISAMVTLISCGGGDPSAPASAIEDARQPSLALSVSAAGNEAGTGPSATWLWVANEGQAMTVRGTQIVRFGEGSHWIEKSITGTGMCSNASFGRDPIFRTHKRCFAKTADAGPDQPPWAGIKSPIKGARFKAGDVISFSGISLDREDGWLTGQRVVFSAELHHDTHVHPFLPPTAGNAGTIEIPVRGETAATVFYRFTFTATDSAGHATVVTRDITPIESTMRFATVPAGLGLTLDGQPVATPASVAGVVGMERDLGAADQVADGRRYRFDHWSDGGAGMHVISTPVADTRFIATFTDLGSAVNQPPSVSLDAAASATTGNPVPLTARAADSDGSIAKVTFYDGRSELGDVTASPYTLAWTPSTIGRHDISARATDNDGAVAMSAVVAVAVSAPTPIDTQAPQAALSAPAAFTANLLGSILIEATATDNVGVQSVEFQVDGGPVGKPVAVVPYAVSLDTTAYASGQHVLRARARDAAGNVSGWSAATVAFGGGRGLPAGFTQDDHQGDGLAEGTSFTQTPDGRVLVAQQGGALAVIRNGVVAAAPLLNVKTSALGERGLLGVALHPDFAANGWVYVYYTSTQGGAHNRISRFVAVGDTTTGVESVLVDLPPLSEATNHNGGAMHFGIDGKLYVGVGDNRNSANAQDLSVPLGKMLRFNDDGSIPADNPFYDTQVGLARAVWASGLRNPFTFAVQPGTGRIHINDVGENTWEEIDLGAPGANYGWPGSEGNDHLTSGITGPLFTYRHIPAAPAGSGPGGFVVGACIAGGAFYPSSGNFPATYRGSYFFADFMAKSIGRIDLANGNAAYAFATLSGDPPVDVMVDNDGALLVLRRNGLTRISAPLHGASARARGG